MRRGVKSILSARLNVKSTRVYALTDNLTTCLCSIQMSNHPNTWQQVLAFGYADTI